MTTPRYLTANQSLQVAAQQIAAGKIQYAKGVVEQILATDPNNVDALHLMSMIHYQEGRLAAAINCSKQAVEVMPDSVALLNNLGTLLKTAGDLKSAQFYYGRAIEVDAKCFPAYFNLAAVIAAGGDYETAVRHYRRAAQLQPDYADVHYNLGIALRKLARYDEAIESLNRAVSKEPGHFQAICEIGTCYSDQNNLEQTIAQYRKAEKIQPNSAELHNNLGVALTTVGELFEAKKHFEKALKLNSSFVEAKNNLAALQLQTGDHNQAIEALTRLVRENPDDEAALRNYGQALNAIGDFERSAEMLKRTVTINAESYEGWLDLAVALTQIQCDKEAQDAFDNAARLKPAAIAPKWGLAMTRLQAFYETEEEVLESFSTYESEINQLADLIESDLPRYADETIQAMRFLTPFYLILHERNFKDVQKRLGVLASNVLAHHYGKDSFSTDCDASRASSEVGAAEGNGTALSTGRVRVGIVSHHFSDHTVYKCITRGWAKEFDRSMFELTAYSTGGVRDSSTAEAQKLFDHYVEIADFEKMRTRILADKQDILLYPGLGLESHTYRLAAMKLAPVQCVSYGHPITIGLPTIDRYFVSEVLEPLDGERHYSETLARLPGLGSFFEPSGIKPRQSDLEAMGVRRDSRLFLCLQHLHKYLPQHDELLAKIAQRVPNAQFVFARKNSRLAPWLAQRLESAFERFGLKASDFVTFLPEISHDRYFGLCEIGHVFLDTPVNSGLMTTLEALEAGSVPVTMPGEFMRSRQTAQILGEIGLSELIADSPEQYVELAVRLASDDGWRKELKERAAQNISRIYRQKDGVRALEKALLKLLEPSGVA